MDCPNLDPTFENQSTTGLWGGSTMINNNAYSGSYAARLDDNSQWGGGFEVEITGLSPLTKYEFSAFVKVSISGESGSLVVKDQGAGPITENFSNIGYENKAIIFTTGLGATSAKIAIYNGAGGTAVLYVDDLSLYDLGPSNPNMLEPIESTDYQLIWNDEFNSNGAIDNT